MMKRAFFLSSIGLLSLCFIVSSQAQIGIFDEGLDVGDPVIPGEVSYDDGTYVILGGGETIGRNTFEDQFYFVYTEVSGSFTIEADPFPISLDGEGGLMIRQDLDADSAHASWLRASDNIQGSNTNAAYGSLFPHIRSLKGGGSIVDGDLENGYENPDNVGSTKLERVGNSIHFYSMNDAGDWVWQRTEVIPMTESVYVGLAVTANGEDLLAEFEFQEVALEEFPLWVGRSIPIDEWNSGETIEVTVTAKASESVDAVVNEVVPALCDFSDVNVSAGDVEFDQEEGTIDWTLDGFDGEATLTYNVTLADRDSGSWQGTFSDGINRVSYIGGDAVLPKNPDFGRMSEPVSVAPEEVVLIQAEEGTPPEEEGAFLGLGVDPRIHSGISVINVGGNASHWIEIPITIQEAGRYYFFGNVRGEDGNSDSWHFEVDDPPAGDNTTRWDINNSDVFQVEWVTRNEGQEEGEGARPFDLDEGEHTIHIANREDSASIEWIAITSDPNLGIGAFDEITGEVFDPLTVLEGLTELGIFDANQDVFEEENPDNLGAEGGAGYDPVKQEYVVVGSGNDIWGTADNFQFIYKEISGDFSLRATHELDPGTSTNEWAKGLLMARENLTPGSPNFATRVRPDGQYSWQYRDTQDAESSSTPGEDRVVFSELGFVNEWPPMRLDREGDTFSTYYFDGSDWIEIGESQTIVLEDPIYVGFAVTAHEVGSLSIGYFSEVEFTVNGEPVPVTDWALY